MPIYTGTSGNDSWTLVAGGTFTLDGLGGTDTLFMGTSLRSSYTITKASDGSVHVDSISSASGGLPLHATLLNMEVLVFNNKTDTLNLLTYFGPSITPTATITDNVPGTATGSVSYSLAFNESISGLTANGFTVTNGSIKSISGSGSTYSVIVEPITGFEGTLGLTLNAGAVTDASGTTNASAVVAAAQAVDTKPPTVVITDNTSGVATGNVTYKLAFSEPVTGLTASGFSVSNGSVGAISGSGSSYSVVIVPNANTEGSMGVALTSGAVFDLAGNSLAAKTAALDHVVDTRPPTVVSFSPGNAASDVAVGANIVLTFSEAIARGVGSIVLKSAAGAVIASYESATDANLSLSGSTLTINPVSDLLSSTGYRVEFTAGSIKDLAGNSYAGTTSYSFTTAPAVVVGKTLIGTAANDTFTTTSGNDTIDGGLGTDTVIFTSARADHSVVKTATGWTVSSTADGTDTLSNVERLQFSDSAVALDLTAANSAGGIYRLYGATFNRTPDAAGLGYWIDQADKGESAVAMAVDFTYSQEFQSLFATTITDNYASGANVTDLVTGFYTNVLHRTPDPAGRDWYADQIATHQKTVGQVLAEISDSPENIAQLAGVIANGIVYTPWHG